MKRFISFLLLASSALLFAHPGALENSVAAAATSSKVLMAYFPEWKANNYPASRIPAGKLSHILYAFGNVNPLGKCTSFDAPIRVATNLKQLAALKEKNPDLKVLISLGGWTGSSNFSKAVLTEQSRQTLVKSCIDLWIKGESLNVAGKIDVAGVIDGIDVDWEYPGAPGQTNNYRPEDKQNYVLLMAEFRRQLDTQGAADGKRYSLSAALGITPDVMQAGLDLPALVPYLDYFNLMTYDFHGGWDSVTNLHNNLFSVPGDPAGDGLNVDSAVQRYLAGGVPADKIVVGVPFYGHGWKNVENVNDGLFQKVDGSLEIAYREIKDKYEPTYTLFRHPDARVPWLYNPSTKIFVSYEDPVSAGEKADYALKHNLAGLMFWEISQDDDPATLTTTLCARLGRTGC